MAQVGAPNPDVELPFADISGTQDIDLRPAAVLKKKPPAKSQPSTRALAQEAPIGKGMQQKLCPKAVELPQSMPRCQLFFFREGAVAFLEPAGLDLYTVAEWALLAKWSSLGPFGC